MSIYALTITTTTLKIMAFWIPCILLICLSSITMAVPPVQPTIPFPLPPITPIILPPLPPIITHSPPPPPVPTPPPSPPHLLPRIVRCRDRIRFPACFNIPFLCPLACLTNCLVDCVTCKPVCSCTAPGAVCQDPRFVGGDGMTFYFHGQKDKDFCLVSDTNLHINGHFIGKRNPKLTRDFTWVQSIGIMFDNHKLLVSAQRTSTWDDSKDRLAISFDENPVSIPTEEGARWDYSRNSSNDDVIMITRTSETNGLMIEIKDRCRVTATVVPITAEESRLHNYDITTNEDCFAHLELGFRFFNLSDSVDGVLGQTYRSNYVSKVKANAVMPVMGSTHRYSASGIFATNCAASRFGMDDMNKHVLSKDYNVRCSSGIQGTGLACK